MTNNLLHQPVLANELIDTLCINPNGVYVDCTAGFGGHSYLIRNKLDNGQLICVDQDENAIKYLTKKFADDKHVNIIHDNFINIKSIFKKNNIAKADGIIVDLGVSSPMFDDPNRGFSYHKNGPLDMRMSSELSVTAADIVNKYDQKQLIHIFRKYGEIKDCSFVVNKIIQARKKTPITTTLELVEIIKNGSNPKNLFKNKHPARQYFQALRIAVNNELASLAKFLSVAPDLININGYLGIITFHSLEDNIVKQAFNFLTTSHLPNEVPLVEKPQFLLIKPIIPSSTEITNNRRSRSAKLRMIKRLSLKEQYV